MTGISKQIPMFFTKQLTEHWSSVEVMGGLQLSPKSKQAEVILLMRRYMDGHRNGSFMTECEDQSSDP